MPEFRHTVKTIFGQALEIRSESERAQYLDQACGGDATLRAEVDDLLAAIGRAGNFLGDARPVDATTGQSIVEEPGTCIGPYKLLQHIGEGGMGVVYMAEQHEPVRRKVALKIIKPGMDTRQVIARFEAERHALSLMDHPHIAKALDAGTTDSGRPYFVMELVRGQPMTEYCDEHHLTPRQRLELFLPVCQAIQHAHQKGIVHRDIKPSNILVAEYDQQPVPKVIDFGVAKATSQPLTEKTMFTGYGQIVGTLEYMSPEQAKVNQLDIDTRSDIYSLGVLLYELLTGTTPFDKQRLRSAAWDEMLRIVREEVPPKPSTRLSDSKLTLASISAQRRTEPAKLTKVVRGELDWIVMKALEKDRNRRYETANGFAMDVQRYLADEPVLACPPSAVYRFHKLVRRNKGPVIAAAVVLLALVAGIAGTTWQAVRAEQARVAETQRGEGERQAKERAEANFALANEAVETYLGTVTNDPELKQADFNRLRKKLLESAIPFFQKLTAQKSDDPEVEAGRGRAFLRLSLVQQSMGEHAAAIDSLEAARAVFDSLVADFPAVPEYRQLLAECHYRLGLAQFSLGKWSEAEASNRLALVMLEELEKTFPTKPAYRESLAEYHNQLGNLLNVVGKGAAAELEYRWALEGRAKLAADFPAEPKYLDILAGSQNDLGLLLQNRGNHEEAERMFRQALAIEEKLVAGFPANWSYRQELARQYQNLGLLLLNQEKYEQAEVVSRRALTVEEQIAAVFTSVPRHRYALALNYHTLGLALMSQQKHPEAEAAFREALRIFEKLAASFPDVPEHRRLVANSLNALGNVLTELGKVADAEAAYRRSLDIYEKLFADFPNVADIALGLGGNYCNFGMLVRNSGDAEASLGWFEKAIATLDAVGKQDPRIVNANEFLRNSYCGRAEALDSLGRYSDAARDWERALEFDRRLAGSQILALRLKLSLSRLRASQANKDAAGCLAASAEYESVNRDDAIGLYDAACGRAICAAVIPADPKFLAGDVDRIAKEQADLAMAWVRKAVAAGYSDAQHMRHDRDLDALREREDFKSLLAELETRSQ